MPFRADLHAASAYLHDEASQILALSDALDSGDAAALVHAFAAVARARGLDRLAADAGVERGCLFRALQNAERPDMVVLSGVVDALLARLASRTERRT